MHLVPTLELHDVAASCFEIVWTHGTRRKLLLLMFVLIFDSLTDTCATGVAVKEIPAATRLAHPATMAVKLMLRGIIVPQRAQTAKVVPECHVAVDAKLCRALDGETEVALDATHILAVELVGDLHVTLALTPLWVQHVAPILFLLFFIGQVTAECTVPAVFWLEFLSLWCEHMLLEALQIMAEPTREEDLALFALELAVAIVVVASLHVVFLGHFESLEARRLNIKLLSLHHEVRGCRTPSIPQGTRLSELALAVG